MSHVLLLEAPGGNDFKILEEARRLGHRVTFFTADLPFYRTVGEDAQAALELAAGVVEVKPFSYEAFESAVLALHASDPFDAVVCLIDIRMVEASRIASRLGLRFLNPQTAQLMRDKHRVREHLSRRGIRQPRFALATSTEEALSALETVGFPAILKPSDGYGSQNVVSFRSPEDLTPVRDLLPGFVADRIDYGFGVISNQRVLVEQLVAGTIVGVDALTFAGKHTVLGINEKAFFPPPSYAISGSCFPAGRFDHEAIAAYVVEMLDALGFDHGATHTELVVTPEGVPYLVEINPRLVGAQIALLLGLALDRSIYADVLNLHLGVAPPPEFEPVQVAVSRWLIAPEVGTLKAIEPPAERDERVKLVRILKRPGVVVGPPFENGDRLGFVMASAPTRPEAEAAADGFVAATRIMLEPTAG